jgi:hypothetical protein
MEPLETLPQFDIMITFDLKSPEQCGGLAPVQPRLSVTLMHGAVNLRLTIARMQNSK